MWRPSIPEADARGNNLTDTSVFLGTAPSAPLPQFGAPFTIRAELGFPTHTETLSLLYCSGYLLFFFFFLLQTEALERSLGNSVWSWCSKPSLYRLARRPSQHPELWAQKATPLASLWCLPHPHPPLQDVFWCQDTAVLMPTGICCCCCCCCVHNDLCLKIL